MANTKVILGFVAGAAIGALAGTLLAPDEGGNTRRKLTGKASGLADSLKNSFSDFVDSVKESYSGAKSEAEGLEGVAKDKINSMKADAKASFS